MVEGARLLSEYTVKNCIEGSNPSLSVLFFYYQWIYKTKKEKL